MDIIHGLSNLDIKTPHSAAEEEEEEEEEVVEEEVRNWLELPPDVISLVLLKLGAVNILSSAQWVCSSWWKLSKQPHLFRSIHVEEVITLFGHSVRLHSIFDVSDGLAREAIDRSCGQLVEFSVRAIADDGLLHYMFENSTSLRCIRLVFCHGVSNIAMMEMAKKHNHLEELEIIHCSFKTFGPSCLLSNLSCFLSELRHLNLYGNKFLTDDGLRAILNGCPHLESLDLRQCSDINCAGDLKERCGNIKVLRLPNDPTRHDYSKCDFDYEYNSYFRMISSDSVVDDSVVGDTESTDYDTDDIYDYFGWQRTRGGLSDDES